MATEDFSGTLANWTQWQPAWGDAFISSGTLRFPGGGSPSNDTGIRWSGAGAGSFGPAQESAADIAGATWIANWAGVGVRMAGSNATRDGYFARLDDNAATNKLLELVKFVDGVQTVLASTTYATGSSFRLRLTVEDSGGNAQLRVYVGATLVTALNHTDSSSPLTGGDPGLIGRGNSGLTVDNWEGGTFTPPAANPVVSAPTVVSTGNGIATVRVTTDTAPSGSSTLAVRTRAAAAPAWSAAEVLASPTATITSGASGARDFNLTGLTNGTALAADFAQTGPSNVVSTASFTPSTVPGAPTIGTAVAGNAQATVNGTAPASTGGATITGYRSTATPGGSTVTGATLPITHTGLTNGTAYTFTLAAENSRGFGAESAASNSVTPAAPGTAPTITVQPSNQTVTAGANATFSVTATGSGLTYQWRRNGTNIGGATSASYTTPATTVSGGSANNGDVYSVATSSNATLTVNAAPGAAGFDFHTAVGADFAAISGALTGLAREIGVSITTRVYADSSPGALVTTLPATLTNSAGRLPRLTDAALVPGTFYVLMFRWPDGDVYSIRMAAT
jgi:hypothetical protein